MKVSVVTVSYNSASTIADTLHSVSGQSYANIEHVIIDGASKDETLRVVQEHGLHVATLVSEPDKGIYDAMCKGFARTTGEVIAFLNSDDCYVDSEVIADVVAALQASKADYAYGDIRMIDDTGKLKRQWKTGRVQPGKLTAKQIPHPALFVCRNQLEKIDPVFDASYRISADLKQQLILVNKLMAQGVYVPRSLVNMRVGGASTADFGSYLKGWKESARAYDEVFGRGGGWYTFLKVASKLKGVRG